MNVESATITMEPEQASKQLKAYRKQLHRRADAEYQACAAGLEALAKGTPLINLTEAIRNGGFDEKMRPKLAVARADRMQVRFSWDWNGIGVFRSQKNPWNSELESLTIRIQISMQRPNDYHDGYALVPMVPADKRPSSPLKEFVILWEVEKWSDRLISSKPPTDPFLLKHIHGDLYAVLAEWELTELEKAVMADRKDK